MKTEKELEEREYLDLYNKGYGIYQFSPELAEMFTHANSNDPRLEPFKAGINKAIGEAEIEQNYIPNWLKEDRFKENSQNIGYDLDKDYEPEQD